MRIAAILIALSLTSGCATYAPGPSPLLGTVLPEACSPELDYVADEQRCGDWFYDLGVAGAKYDISRTGYYNPNGELLTDEYQLNRFAQGYKDARTTLGAPSMASYSYTQSQQATSTQGTSSLNMPAQPGGIDRYGMNQATGPVINGVH